ncbi:glucosidase II alpha subunit [Lineolata rhizophorae]|uniref:alpha-glucosidase n=1 Tax=Lineolata rhizophorae TaxID=578093 RepID=A0A6A6NWH4_9PEZI|nr:glucosidase II alpha subunit [Lineolata rhizophorae]
MAPAGSPVLTWGRPLLLVLSVLCNLILPSAAVKHDLFKTCSQSGFCARNRAYADAAASLSSSWASPYALDPSSLSFSDGQLRATVVKAVLGTDATANFPLTVSFLESGVARVTLDEERRRKGDIELRHGSKARKERYDEAAKWALVGGLELSKGAVMTEVDDPNGAAKVRYGPDGKFEAVVTFAPFSLEFLRDGATHVKFNERGLLNMEHWRQKKEKVEGEGEGEEGKQEMVDTPEDESTWWDESFGGNTDSKPRGPESVALDISFPGYEHVYGIPEHASSMSLKQTRGGHGNYNEPYRLYNADVFEYIMDSPMTLYGAIPFMQAHRKDSTVGLFWLNAAETWIDIVKAKTGANPLSLGVSGKTNTQTHWMSESGLLDVFVFLGPTPRDVTTKYGELTGFTQLPQEFAIAYHQCRWNYVTDQDVMAVDRKFDKHDIPYDVIWLDIEYTQEKKYFTFDPLTFPDPKKMHAQLDGHHRKLVAIIDPHIKNVGDYPIVDEMKSKGLAAMNKDGNAYEGWCWPGSSYWVDCFNPLAIEWWKGLFKYDRFIGTAPNTFIWNDMNEPSVFNGPETTMPKDNLHHGNWEHRDVHNLNGLTFVNATYEAMLYRDGKKPADMRRPFVLTRSFYAGSQRMGAMWTGDNQADWSHLAASLPMILNNGISGFPFAGADVGGFFGNPSKELLTRWYQAGAFYPFFRGHAHIDTRRREPYLVGEPYTSIITQALRLRYALLPAWYTAFHEASVTGAPVVRPMFYEHPADEASAPVDDQMYLGGTGLLVKPVTAEGQTAVDVYLPDSTPYFDYFDFTRYAGPGVVRVPAPLEKVPLLMGAGHIIPRRDRPRRSSGLMKYDPLTLVVVLDEAGGASGEVYLDDGESFDFEQGGYIHRRFALDAGTRALTSVDVAARKGAKTAAFERDMAGVKVERVVVVNAPEEWKGKTEVHVSEEGARESQRRRPVGFEWVEGAKGKASWAVVRNPKVGVGKGWKIDFS